MPERIQKEAAPAACSVRSRSQQKSFLFLLEEKIRRAQIRKSEENFFDGWRALASGGGAASLVGVLLKESSNINQKRPQMEACVSIGPPAATGGFMNQGIYSFSGIREGVMEVAGAVTTTKQDTVPKYEELLARINEFPFSAVFAAVGEVYNISPVTILKNHPKGREKSRETIFRAQQTVIYLLLVDYHYAPQRILEVFPMKLWQMTAKCRGIIALAELGGEFVKRIEKARARLHEPGSLSP